MHRALTTDGTVDALRRVSGLVSVLALGQDRPALGDPLVLGRVATAVPTAARGPVVLVPRDWDREHGAGRPVVVVLDRGAPAAPPLRCAFVEADLDGLPVVVVRAAAGPPEGDEGGTEGAPDDPDEVERAYAETFSDAHRAHPGVEARTVVVPDDPARAGCPTRRPWRRSWWSGRPGRVCASRPGGPPAGPLLRRSGCPLLVAPSDDPPPGPLTSLRRRTRSRARRR